MLLTDDVVMLVQKCEDLERNPDELKKEMNNWDMKIYWRKTKVMMVGRSGDLRSVSTER